MTDGSALGIRQCEILNRTIHALSVSRLRLAELKEWEEAKRAGVYFLFGKTEDGNFKAYNQFGWPTESNEYDSILTEKPTNGGRPRP